MSGHSHWKTIKRTKEAEDKKRAKIFSKLAREISIAAKEKGKTPETNSKLRLIIEKAKQYNFPKDNIERAIKKGVGELSGEKLEEVFLEAYCPNGITLIIEGITDNKNRSIGEIRQILAQYQGKLASHPGSTKWLFERKIDAETGLLNWEAKEKIEIEEEKKHSCQGLFNALNENDAVQKVYSNLKI